MPHMLNVVILTFDKANYATGMSHTAPMNLLIMTPKHPQYTWKPFAAHLSATANGLKITILVES